MIEVLRPATTVLFAENSRELLARMASGPIGLVILECRDGNGCQTLPAVQAIRSSYPSVPIVAYTSPGQTSSSDILAMAHAGVHELIMQGFDDVGVALRTVIESAARRCVANRVMHALRLDLPPVAVPFMQFCLDRVWLTPTVEDAARYLGVHPKTLNHRLRRTLMPPPSAMIGWCRLFVAGHMLEDPGRSVAQIALALDFSSSTALRGMLRRYTGLRPNEVRERGGLAAVICAFRALLHEPADSTRSSGRG